MTDVRETGLNVFRELLLGVLPDGEVNLRGDGFGDEIMEIGLTDDEIAEVVYHASGYAGFPAANTACKIAREALS